MVANVSHQINELKLVEAILFLNWVPVKGGKRRRSPPPSCTLHSAPPSAHARSHTKKQIRLDIKISFFYQGRQVSNKSNSNTSVSLSNRFLK